jgi:K+-sensing histidine kinase KdpD
MLAFMIRYSLSPLIQPFAVFHFFILSCLAIQYFFGYRYALAGMVASILLGEYFFVEPVGTFDEVLVKDVIISFNFITVTLSAIVLMEIFQRGLYARDLMLKVGNSRHLLSLQRENDRLYYAQKSSEAWYVLELLIKDFEHVILLQHGHDPVRLEPLFYQLTGLSPADIPAAQWEDCVHPEDRPALARHFQGLPATQRGSTSLNLHFGWADRFSGHATRVQVRRFEFMGQPLILLTLE